MTQRHLESEFRTQKDRYTSGSDKNLSQVAEAFWTLHNTALERLVFLTDKLFIFGKILINQPVQSWQHLISNSWFGEYSVTKRWLLLK